MSLQLLGHSHVPLPSAEAVDGADVVQTTLQGERGERREGEEREGRGREGRGRGEGERGEGERGGETGGREGREREREVVGEGRGR